jgi:dienelactone hydrolase
MGNKSFQSFINLPKKFSSKIPLIIIVHEWWGRNDYIRKREQMLNELGYATLAVDIYGNDTLVETPEEAEKLSTPFYKDPMIGISRLSKYLDLAKKDPHIDEENIFVIGYCFGGSQALNLARSGAIIKGVVSFHGALHSNLEPKNNIKTKFLILNGEIDPMVTKTDIKEFKGEMNKAKIDYSIINFKNATHAFTNPQSTEIGKKYNLPVAYDEKADKKSWQDFLTFLKNNSK